LQFSPNNTVLRKMLAEALFNLTRYQESENEYKTLLDIDSNADIKTGLAKCFYQLQKVEASHILLDEILKQEPDHAEANYYFAKASFLKGDYKQAKLSYDIASSLNDDFEDEDFELQVNQKLRESGMAVANLADDLNENDDNFFADIEKPKINFSDVGGMDKVKEEIALKVIHPLNNPEIYKAFGKKIGGGILLYGPPGCGKTHIARATAGEIKANFISVGISDVLDMWQGNSEKNLHSLFQKARNSTPCVLFFDEVDAMGASRSDMRSNSSRFFNQSVFRRNGWCKTFERRRFNYGCYQ
jgi:transitional endoplasmic reticulum ATPase